ncbi:MAG: tRNA uridine-5-carboxymethylaminomethyl(34) synthesis GTPase MnmE [Kiritimatiellia bacterium]
MCDGVMQSEPIAAIATAPGVGGIAVLRMSGDGVYAIADALTRLRVPPSQRAAGTFVHAELFDAEGQLLDDALVLCFRAPHSYTGEDTVELQLHGGRVVSEQVLECVWALGARPAAPGEFTKRAFLNGRLDLTQAEAVADVIAARSPRAERCARAALNGRLGTALSPLYEATLALSVQTEHLLDFDEGELPERFFVETRERLAQIVQRISALLATWHEGRLLREGARVVLAGKPNAGKSSLLNLLLGYNRAIVSAEAGTTRDSIEETFLVDGVPIRLIDTAGLRETACAIENEGVDRTRALLAEADAVLYLIAVDDSDTAPEGATVLHTKGDLCPERCDTLSVLTAPDVARAQVCAKLREILRLEAGETDSATLATSRQFSELSTAATALGAAEEALARGEMGYVPAAQQLRDGAEALGRILGRTYSEDLLERVFSTFCVGK